MSDLRTLEEFVFGIDGDDAKALRPILEAVAEDSKKDGHDTLLLECRTTPAGTGRSGQEWTTQYKPAETPVRSLLTAMLKKLEESPGESFFGQLRFNWKALEEHGWRRVKSYTRTMRPGPGVLVDDDGNELPQATAAAKKLYIELLRPHAEMTMRAMSEATALIHACAQLVQAQHAPASARGGDAGIIPDLVKGALGIAAANSNADRARAAGQVANVGTRLLTGSVSGTVNPPAPIPHPAIQPPSPGSTATTATAPADGDKKLTMQEIRKWAQGNPSEARTLMIEAMQSE